MDVPLAVLADAANVAADGRLNILGIFGEIRSSQTREAALGRGARPGRLRYVVRAAGRDQGSLEP